MRRRLAPLLVLLHACGGAPAPVDRLPQPGPTPGPAPVSCAALKAAVEAREVRARRRRAEDEARASGDTVEQVLAEWDAEVAADGVAPYEEIARWTCPAEDAGHHLPQPEFAPVALPGAVAELAIIERFDDEATRFVFVAFRRPSRPPEVVLLGRGFDANGQEWGQFHVASFAADGGALRVTARDLSCVGAGFDEETTDAPPSCLVAQRWSIRCAVTDTEARCDREGTSGEEDEYYP